MEIGQLSQRLCTANNVVNHGKVLLLNQKNSRLATLLLLSFVAYLSIVEDDSEVSEIGESSKAVLDNQTFWDRDVLLSEIQQ